MSLYKAWTDTVVEYVKNEGANAFWNEYAAVEKIIYSKILSNQGKIVKGKVSDLAEQYGITDVFFMGFLDSLNPSLNSALKLEDINEDSIIELDINYEKLYSSMLEAGTESLYNLPQWEAALSSDAIKDIRSKFKGVKAKKNKIGRNDPCPCGSGLKYKNCCGK